MNGRIILMLFVLLVPIAAGQTLMGTVVVEEERRRIVIEVHADEDHDILEACLDGFGDEVEIVRWRMDPSIGAPNSDTQLRRTSAGVVSLPALRVDARAVPDLSDGVFLAEDCQRLEAAVEARIIRDDPVNLPFTIDVTASTDRGGADEIHLHGTISNLTPLSGDLILYAWVIEVDAIGADGRRLGDLVRQQQSTTGPWTNASAAPWEIPMNRRLVEEAGIDLSALDDRASYRVVLAVSLLDLSTNTPEQLIHAAAADLPSQRTVLDGSDLLIPGMILTGVFVALGFSILTERTRDRSMPVLNGELVKDGRATVAHLTIQAGIMPLTIDRISATGGWSVPRSPKRMQVRAGELARLTVKVNPPKDRRVGTLEVGVDIEGNGRWVLDLLLEDI